MAASRTRDRAGAEGTAGAAGSVATGSGDRNHVVLRGRVAADPTCLVLPSGDPLVTFRLVVRRPDPTDHRGSPPRASQARGSQPRAAQSVDTLDCSAWRPRVRRSVLSWTAGDVVEVQGAVRRRFWRGPAGLQSRWEVEVESVQRLTRASSATRSRVERA